MAAMAAVKSKVEESFTNRDRNVDYASKSKSLAHQILDLCLSLISLFTFVADLSTDIILVVSYLHYGRTYWAIGTLTFIVVPAVIVQLFSIRWYMADKNVHWYHWITHAFLLGVLHRYVELLKTGLETRSSGDSTDLQRLYHQWNDLCILHLFQSFLESAPQLLLQLYIMVNLEEWWNWTGVHWIAMTTWIILQKTDFCATVWEERIYNCVVGVIYCFCFFNLKDGPSRRKVLIFYCITVAQNLGCLGVFITMAGYTRPILAQVGAGAILGGSVIGLSSMLLYYRYFQQLGPTFGVAPITQPTSDTGCTTVSSGDPGTGYRSLKGHGALDNRNAPQRLNNATQEDSTNVDDSCTDKKLLLNHWVSYPTTTPTESVKTDVEIPCVKENFQLNGDCTTANQSNDDIRKQKRRGICSSEVLELELEDKKEMSTLDRKGTALECEERHKRRGICSLEQELNLDFEMALPPMDSEISQLSGSAEVDNSDEIRRQKRRGILSSADLCLELEEDAKHIINTENKSHVIVDLNTVEDRKENNFNNHDFKCDLIKEASVLETQGLKSSDLRLVANEEATSEVLSAPSEVLSAHDYENICAVNIAREAWGLRSWRGYSDIETWLHDDSVVRDRRRDTLTSTVTTITSASSEQSAASGERAATPPPLPSRKPRTTRSRQDDYLDTLADDLAACDRPLAEFTTEPEIDTSLYVARPYLIDQHGTFFPLTTLDTIMEEIEETSTDTSDSVRYWHKHGSASTLVATIDEIRRGNSICNLYNSTELLWDTCGNAALNLLNDQNESLCENSVGHHASYENNYTGGSYSHLSPEEVLFLSKLKPSVSELSCSSDKTPNRRNNASAYETNSCLSYNNDIITENQFADTMPLALKNNFGIKKSTSKAHRKFLLLQEKFESKQNDNLKSKEEKSASGLSSSMDNIDNESNTQVFAGSTEALVPVNDSNETPAVIHRIHQWNNFLKSQTSSINRTDSNRPNSLTRSPENNQTSNKSSVSSLKERRTMFLKQVLSPPRFQNWSKKGTSSIGSMQLRAS